MRNVRPEGRGHPRPTPPLATRVVVLALGLALGLGGGPPLRAAHAGDDAQVAAAEAALAAGDARRAIEIYRGLVEAPGGDADASLQHGLGLALLAYGDPNGAAAALRIAVRIAPTAARRIALADALLRAVREALAGGPVISGQVTPLLNDAIDELAASRAAGVPAASVPRMLAVEGEIRWLLGDNAAARKALSDPTLANDPTALDLLARVCWTQGDFAAAGAAWRAAGNPRGAAAALARAKDPACAAAYAALVTAALDDQGLADEAIGGVLYAGAADAFDAALAAATVPAASGPTVARLRGRLAERGEKLATAVARYREVMAAHPDDPEAWADLARVLLRHAPDDPATVDESVGLLERVLAVRPDDPWARQGLDWQARKDANAAPREWPRRAGLDRACRLFRRLAEADPTDAAAWGRVGNVLRLAGDPKGSLEAYERAVAENPFDASLWNDRGIALLAAGDLPGALASWAKSIELEGGDPSPRQNSARLRWLSGDDDGAAAHYAAALHATRTVTGHPMLFRSFLDRVWRTKARPELR